VLDTLSLSFEDAHIHGIVGLNGAGKTTLMNTLFGLKKPDSGTIRFNNNALNKKEVAFLPTENFFYTNITGHEYLSLIINSRFDTLKWNSLFDLPLNKLIDTYSTGMKKKLAFMGILKQDKPIMILDEPFNGLDLETCRVLRSILLKLRNNGKTIIITSHIMETLTNLCDQIHYLEKGQIRYSKQQSEFAAFEKEIFDFIEHKNRDLLTELI
jgi:ABC-2 type transport system ATP-binding protein